MAKKREIYKFLAEGEPAVHISKYLHVSKAYVSKVINELLTGGYIICVNPKGKPKLYAVTKKKYTEKQSIKDQKNAKLTRLYHRYEIIQIQKCSYKSQITHEPTKGKWDKIYNLNSTKVFEYRLPIKDFGNILFKRFKSNNKDTLLIILPRFLIHKEELKDIDNILLEKACMAVSRFKKLFNVGITKPVICQKPDKAVPSHDLKIIDEVQTNGTMKVGDIMIDASEPHNFVEVESKDSRDIINYLDTINKMKYIEDISKNNSILLSNLIETLKTFGENQSRIIGIIQEKEKQNNLKYPSFDINT